MESIAEIGHGAAMRGITWILVADTSRVRLFEHRRRSEDSLLPERAERVLVPIFEDDRPELRDREQRRYSDRPGRVHESNEPMRHAAEPRTSIDERVREHYARDLIDRLHAEASKRRFHNLVLVAPPALLGMLRKLLSDDLASRVVGELAKDLAWVSEHDLPQHLREWLEP